jgi:hypothetical protein
MPFYFADYVLFMIYNYSNILDSTIQFQCNYCSTVSTDKYRNLIENHTKNEIKFKRINEDDVKVCAYKITAELRLEQGRTNNIDDKNL